MPSGKHGSLPAVPPQRWRTAVPRATVELLVRERLLSRLAGRFTHRLTVLRAGAGFGKTTLLAQAIFENRLAGPGHDRYWRCATIDASSAGLGIALCAVLDIAMPDDPEKVPAALASKVWAAAPQHIAIVLDDAHLLWRSSEACRLLEQLIDALPMNGHVVLATRTTVPLRIAQLEAAAQVLSIDEGELCFTDAERGAFSALRGLDTELELPSWPAMAELAARGRSGADYLQEQFPEHADGPTARALQAIIALGGADDELASAYLGAPVELALLLADLPLVARDAGGSWTAHALWHEQVREMKGHLSPQASTMNRPSEEHTGSTRRTAQVLRARGETGRAVRLLASVASHHEMLAAMRDACIGFEPTVSYLDLADWLTLIPVEMKQHPVALVVRGFTETRTDQRAALSTMLAAATALAQSDDDVELELKVLIQIGRLVFRTGQTAAVADAVVRVAALASRGHADADALLKAARVLSLNNAGDEAALLRACRGIDIASDPDLICTVAFQGAISAMTLGRADECAAFANLAMANHGPSTRSIALQTCGFAAWSVGDIESRESTAAEGLELARRTNSTINVAMFLRSGAIARAFAGDPDAAVRALDALDEEGLAKPDDPFEALARAAVAVSKGDEELAADRLRVTTESLFAGSPVTIRTLSHSPALSYVLLPETRPFWEARVDVLADDVGPSVHLAMCAAQALLRARRGEPVGSDAAAVLGVPALRTAIPAHWSVEIAIALAREGADDTAVIIVKLLGRHGASILRTFQAGDRTTKQVVNRLRSHLPIEPAGPVLIDLFGPGQLRCGNSVLDESSGESAFALVACLALDGPLRRDELCRRLWPGANAAEHERRLKEALRRVRAATEHSLKGRPVGPDGWLIRSSGGTLRITEENDVAVDIWNFDRLVSDADAAIALSAPSLAMNLLLHATDDAKDDLLTNGPDEPWVSAARVRTLHNVASACARVAALLAADRQLPTALRAARRAVRLDPTVQTAWCVLLECLLALGDRTGARDMAARCRRALADRGVDPETLTEAVIAQATGARRVVGVSEPLLSDDAWAALSPAELGIVSLVSEGLTNKSIAERRRISVRTVDAHLSHVFTKLGTTSRAQLAAEAVRRGAVASEAT